MGKPAAKRDSVEDDVPIKPKSIKTLTSILLKRTYDMFVGNHNLKTHIDEASQKAKISSKVKDEYSSLDGYIPRQPPGSKQSQGAANGGTLNPTPNVESKSSASKLIDAVTAEQRAATAKAAANHRDSQLVLYNAPSAAGAAAGAPRITAAGKAALTGTIMIPTAAGGEKEYTPSAAIAKRMPSKWPRPQWRAPWKTYRVISGHLGWVRSVAFDPTNDWFATGSGDRTIKIWETASGKLRLTLTGHTEQVTGLSVSERHPYMFSCGLDKAVKCWDLEQNKVIRNYHGHLSGVYSLALHPVLDILATGGRDSTCRVWDMRTKVQIFALSGHQDNVCAILMQGTDPQIITGSHDKTIKLWDLRMGKTLATLTNHKKAVRAVCFHSFLVFCYLFLVFCPRSIACSDKCMLVG